MLNFLSTYHPAPVVFSIGLFSIHWYGVFLSIGFLFSLLILHRLWRDFGFPLKDLDPLLFRVVCGGIIGARIYYVIYAWEWYGRNLWDILKIWEGGLAIHGVIIGGLIGLWSFVKKYKYDFKKTIDMIIVAMPFGQAIGRWGNYFNQELYGTPTSLPWGIPIDSPVNGFKDYAYFHPTFLYESILNLILGASLLFLMKRRLTHERDNHVTEKAWYENAGSLLACYLIGYGLIRFCMEFFRIDYSPYVFGIRVAQLVSLAIIIIGVIFLYKITKKR